MRKLSRNLICSKCKHTHIAETGGKDGYTITEERLSSCCYCDCEKGYSFIKCWGCEEVLNNERKRSKRR